VTRPSVDVVPSTSDLAIGTVLVVGMLGAYLPARLVLDVDPAATLREE
jgi:ABC-type antimicrobial peptide transport system permease subunit